MSTPDTLKILCVSWQTIKTCYDLTADLPGWDSILHGVDLSRPEEAAHTMLINLLTEAMEKTDRFSPWYTAPAEAFGLHQPLKDISSVSRAFFQWQITSEAETRWRPTLRALAKAIAKDSEIHEIQKTLDATKWLRRSAVKATCACEPDPPTVQVPPHVLLEATLFCNVCGQPLRRIEKGTNE